MAAPTPVSAYLHSATMVKAGVYLLGRFAPVFARVAPWRALVLGVGLVTMIAGGLRALRQHDLKLLLAFGTVSQLGFLVVLFGAGTTAATQAGIVLLIAHALFKAMAFMVVGIVDHQAGTRDVRLLPALLDGWTSTKVVAIVSAASMAGVPLLLGFVAKESAYAAFTGGPFGGSGLVLVAIVVGSTLTVAYSLRFLGGFRQRRPAGQVPPPPSAWFVAPSAILGAATIVTGVAPAMLDRLVSSATLALDPGGDPEHLALWHGLNSALALTMVTFAAGAVLFAYRAADVATAGTRGRDPVRRRGLPGDAARPQPGGQSGHGRRAERNAADLCRCRAGHRGGIAGDRPAPSRLLAGLARVGRATG